MSRADRVRYGALLLAVAPILVELSGGYRIPSFARAGMRAYFLASLEGLH